MESHHLPHGWRKPQRLEYWLRERFPELEFVCRRFKLRGDGYYYMSIKATIANHPAKLRYHQHIRLDQLWRQDRFDLLLAQLWLVTPRR